MNQKEMQQYVVARQQQIEKLEQQIAAQSLEENLLPAYLLAAAISERVPQKNVLQDCIIQKMGTGDEAEALSQLLEHCWFVCDCHSITSTIYPGLKQCEIFSGENETAGNPTQTSFQECLKPWEQAYTLSTMRQLLFDSARKEILNQCEQAGISYLPLKGIWMKDYYPKTGMRRFADNDILYDESRAEDMRQIMENLGYHTESFLRANHDVYTKKPGLNFEMHRRLVSETHPLSAYFAKVWERAIPMEGTSAGYQMTKEDFYIFFLAHAHKHYSGGGTGLRTLSDIQLFLNKEGNALDWDYINGELVQLDLVSFEKKIKDLANALLGDVWGDEDKKTAGVYLPLQKGNLSSQQMEDYLFFLSQGTYGSISHRIKKNVDSEKNKFQYCLSRLFPGKAFMNQNFPVTKKYPVLYPIWIVGRWIRLFSRWKKIRIELKVLTGGKSDAGK